MYQDLDVYGSEAVPGVGKELFDIYAVKNAILMWFLSKKGDYIYDPSEGGILYGLTFKNIDTTTIEMLTFKIENAFENKFSNFAKLLSVDIIPNLELRYQEINVIYYDIINNEESEVQIYLDDPSQTSELITYEIVELEAENLFIFVKIKKPEMVGKKLSYNLNQDCWLWGNEIKFPKLNTSDPYFSEVLAYCNFEDN